MEGNSVIMLTVETDDRHGVKECYRYRLFYFLKLEDILGTDYTITFQGCSHEKMACALSN